ncbi:MAG: VOC family protein [Spirochaetes bacterium]|nr:VOC family protein [Spirochaetota bacterium]
MAKKAKNPVPEGMHTVTVHLWFDGDCGEAVEFYKKALGMEVLEPPVPTPDGKGILHALLKLGDSRIMMADAWPGSYEQGPKENATAGLYLYVEDCDALYERAVSAGCEVTQPIMDAWWGDKNGQVKDPFGHVWSIASRKLDLTPHELEKRQQEWLDGLAGAG